MSKNHKPGELFVLRPDHYERLTGAYSYLNRDPLANYVKRLHVILSKVLNSPDLSSQEKMKRYRRLMRRLRNLSVAPFSDQLQKLSNGDKNNKTGRGEEAGNEILEDFWERLPPSPVSPSSLSTVAAAAEKQEEEEETDEEMEEEEMEEAASSSAVVTRKQKKEEERAKAAAASTDALERDITRTPNRIVTERMQAFLERFTPSNKQKATSIMKTVLETPELKIDPATLKISIKDRKGSANLPDVIHYIVSITKKSIPPNVYAVVDQLAKSSALSDLSIKNPTLRSYFNKQRDKWEDVKQTGRFVEKSVGQISKKYQQPRSFSPPKEWIKSPLLKHKKIL